jgi:hypothetical protein
MLKIQRSVNGRVVFTLSGRIEAADVTDSMNGFEVSGRLTDVWRLLETQKSDFRAQKLISPVADSGQLTTAESRV